MKVTVDKLTKIAKNNGFDGIEYTPEKWKGYAQTCILFKYATKSLNTDKGKLKIMLFGDLQSRSLDEWDEYIAEKNKTIIK